MKTILSFLSSALIVVLTTGCTTVQTATGSRSELSPMGAAIAQTLVSTGLGAGTGALMSKAPSWANGAISATVGSVGSQVVNSFIPQSGSEQQSSYRPVSYGSQQNYQPYSSNYQQSYQENGTGVNNQPQGRTVYVNGTTYQRAANGVLIPLN